MTNKFLGIGGTDGTTARPIKTDEIGNITVILEKSKMDTIVYTKDNPLLRTPGTGNAYSPVDFHNPVGKAGDKYVYVPLSEVGSFDASIFLHSSLNVPLKNIKVYGRIPSGNGLFRNTETFALFSELKTHASGTSLFLLPVENTNWTGTASDPIRENTLHVPELSQPIPGVVITYTLDTAPSSGEVTVTITRRY